MERVDLMLLKVWFLLAVAVLLVWKIWCMFALVETLVDDTCHTG